eukprot:7386978-Prymnesium_polylepis.1
MTRKAASENRAHAATSLVGGRECASEAARRQKKIGKRRRVRTFLARNRKAERARRSNGPPLKNAT